VLLLSAGVVNVDGTLLVRFGHSSHSSSSELSLSRRGYGVLDIDWFGMIKQSVVLTLYDVARS
jgi:hypothetical protein